MRIQHTYSIIVYTGTSMRIQHTYAGMILVTGFFIRDIICFGSTSYLLVTWPLSSLALLDGGHLVPLLYQTAVCIMILTILPIPPFAIGMPTTLSVYKFQLLPTYHVLVLLQSQGNQIVSCRFITISHMLFYIFCAS